MAGSGITKRSRNDNRADRPRTGRSAPRSRFGCELCKHRRVRCDETHPVCGHCSRLRLDCYYDPRPLQQPRHNSIASGGHVEPVRPPTQSRSDHEQPSVTVQSLAGPLTPAEHQSAQRPSISDQSQPVGPLDYPSEDFMVPAIGHQFPWQSSIGNDMNDPMPEFNLSWAGEFSCLFPDQGSPPGSSSNVGVATDNAISMDGNILPVGLEMTQARGQSSRSVQSPSIGSFAHPKIHRQSIRPSCGISNEDEDTAHLFELFDQIVQPPAAILIGGFRRWRHLQQYLYGLGEHSRAVHHALLCFIEALALDHLAETDHTREERSARILSRHDAACNEIRTKLSKHPASLKTKTQEHLLAAVFLLAWYEVIRDQREDTNVFPRDLAEWVLADGVQWSHPSQQLLSWLSTLDTKATHLGGKQLLSPKALEVVSRYPTQIALAPETAVASSDSPLSQPSGDSVQDTNSQQIFPSVGQSQPQATGEIKQMMVNTVLQPALQWYLTSQSYCRRISSHNKHHRNRFTSDDEYEVITACKQLEKELWQLWEHRPAIISLTSHQLTQVVVGDVAARLEEIFSVYLASFWILFVYLHRTSWWSLPHSPGIRRSLDEVWTHLQRAYGEDVPGQLRKVVHPALLWPLFLYGSECTDIERRGWAIEQLDALGEAKPVLKNDSSTPETLQPFKLSSGATRNAKRAASLLRELIKRQDQTQTRVDDRDLSMKMFGCYFSIV